MKSKYFQGMGTANQLIQQVWLVLKKYAGNCRENLIRPFGIPSAVFMGVFLAFILCAGCEKVIDVDLNESEPAVVIEGNLAFGKGELEVKISKTRSYFSNDSIEKVENATVILENIPGMRVTAEEANEGIYTVKDVPANPGSVYRLTVQHDGKEYTGVSALHPFVKIDSLNYEYQPEQIFFEGGYRLILYFNDPLDEENYYRVRISKNGTPFNDVDDLIVFDDDGFNGKSIRIRLRGQNFEQGDTANVELLSIDRNAWEYFSTLSEMASLNPGSPSPANPVSNMSNGALGYFSVWTVSSKSVIIPGN